MNYTNLKRERAPHEDEDITPNPPWTAAGKRQREAAAILNARDQLKAEKKAAKKAVLDVESGERPAVDADAKRGKVAHDI